MNKKTILAIFLIAIIMCIVFGAIALFLFNYKIEYYQNRSVPAYQKTEMSSQDICQNFSELSSSDSTPSRFSFCAKTLANAWCKM